MGLLGIPTQLSWSTDYESRGAKTERLISLCLAAGADEYVSGPADSEWGKKRTADGFPEPFPLRYVEIGNEDWFDRSGSYDGRFTQMARVIRARYPHLKIIATAPGLIFSYRALNERFMASLERFSPTLTSKPARFSSKPILLLFAIFASLRLCVFALKTVERTPCLRGEIS